MVKHYEGVLGTFNYDSDEFKIMRTQHLHYIGKKTDGSRIQIPEGIKDCSCMFEYCISLETPPIIPRSVQNCPYMFNGCASLKTPPVIPEGVKNCYGMFYECASLKEAPVIPEGVKDCYKMFYGCTSLKTAPVIPESAKDCRGMFYDCTSLEAAPVIPEGVEICQEMFYGCSDSIEEAGRWNIDNRGQDYYKDGPFGIISVKPLKVDAERRFVKMPYKSTPDGSALMKYDAVTDKGVRLHKDADDNVAVSMFRDRAWWTADIPYADARGNIMEAVREKEREKEKSRLTPEEMEQLEYEMFGGL